MGLADRLGPDLRDPEVDEVRGDEHARLDRGSDADDGDREVLGTDLAEGVDAARIRLNGVGDPLGPLLHESRVLVDGEDLAVESMELTRGRRAEAPQTDDEHGSVVGNAIDHRSAFLLRAGTARA